MHQRRSLRPTLARYAVPTTTAVVGAWSLVVLNAFPLCVLWTPDNPEWWLFFCYLSG